MEPAALQRYLLLHIPLSGAMATQVVEGSPERVVLEAPLTPNLNHRNTAFGGSVSALAVLAGWALVHLRLRDDGHAARTVIQRSDVAYLAPVTDAFQARALPPGDKEWARFLRSLTRWGRGRIGIRVEVFCREKRVAEMTGEYVALKAD